MSDAIRSLLDRARRGGCHRSIRRGVVVGCAIASVSSLVASVLVGWPRSAGVLVVIPVAALIAWARRRPTDVALARAIDERFATGELLATALRVADDDDDAVGRAVVAQADALAVRLAAADLGSTDPRPLAAASIGVVLSIVLAAGIAPPRRTVNVERANAPADVTEATAIEASRDDRPRATASGDPTSRGEAESADASHVADADAVRADVGRSPGGGTSPASDVVRLALRASPNRDVSSADAAKTAAGDGDAAGDRVGIARADGTAGRATIDVDSSEPLAPADVAQRAIDAGQVPAASRSIVRAFFDPGDATR